jgi:site-specific recombinase XerD
VKSPFQRALKGANISDFRFHDLRHTFASHFVMNGGDLLSLKEILGHSSLQMVQRYAHLSAAHKREQINNLSGMFTKICHKYDSSGKSVAKL